MENFVQQNITFKNRIPTPKEVAKRRFPCPTAIKLCMDTIRLLKKCGEGTHCNHGVF
jgi:hypothetical protein